MKLLPPIPKCKNNGNIVHFGSIANLTRFLPKLMRLAISLLIAVLLPVVIASQEAEEIFSRDKISIDLTVRGGLEIKPKDSAPRIDYLQADLFFYPKNDYLQKIRSIKTRPSAENLGSALRFIWESPKQTALSYEANSIVDVQNSAPKVRTKIQFPIRQVPAEARQYLEPTTHIDSNNPAIISLANNLAQGKDDLFVVASEIAIWTKKNIEYNLSTLTAEVSQKASWVLEHKEGVCDELTSLFIAMLRALGIPARFVTGVSYTASPLFPDRWGAHGWAEVYFPDIGWIPFDPTFGEFGWIDPGHIKMMTSTDPDEPSVKFEWKGNTDLKITEPEVNASIIATGQTLPPLVALSIKPLYDETGFGSANLVHAKIRNLNDYYATTEVRLARVQEFEALEPYDQQVILRPREEKQVFWRIKLQEDLLEQYEYTIPLGIYTIRNESALNSFVAHNRGSMHTVAEATRAMNLFDTTEETSTERALEIECNSDKTTLTKQQTAGITCNFQNTGNTPIKALRACLENSCSIIDIGIGQQKKLSFTQAFTTPGKTTLFVQANTEGISKSIPIGFIMQDAPRIEVLGLNAPGSIAYGEKFVLSFALKPTSYTTPKNIEVIIKTPARTKKLSLDALAGTQAFDVEMNAKDLSLGITPITIMINYEDNQGTKYSTSAGTQTSLADVPVLPKIWLWVRGLFE